MINVVCVLRQGGVVGYDASWVEKLQNTVARNLTLPYKFICLSDCDVPCERIPLETAGDGFWAKMQLFKPGIFTGPVLYIDLDTVICQNIDEIVINVSREQFVMWVEPDKQIHSSAMMWWQGDYSNLWDLYKSKNISHWKEKYAKPPLYGDQALISENVKHTLFVDHVPAEWFHVVKKHDDSLDLSKVKILHFRKAHTKPSTLPNHPLVKKHWI
jgi:hypothetical protein